MSESTSEFFVVSKGCFVKHAQGTSEEECIECGSWIAHWENISGEEIPKECPLCSVRFCSDDPEREPVGAHVRFYHSSKKLFPLVKGVWIIPVCKSCNSSGDGAKLKFDICAVTADECDSDEID